MSNSVVAHVVGRLHELAGMLRDRQLDLAFATGFFLVAVCLVALHVNGGMA